jgi:sortase (surface protein transpeptidase)
LGRALDGTLEVPSRFDEPGWYRLGPAPGQTGAAVIVGHVDSVSGPAVFWRLGQLRPGNRIEIRREDGRTITFTVYAVQRYPKNDFPTVQVYGETHHRAELRVITCGGSFDQRTGHYDDNTVAFAALTRVR